MDIDVEMDPVIPDHQPFSTMNGTALSICFVFLSLGLGSFLKEFNKATKVRTIIIIRSHFPQCSSFWV